MPDATEIPTNITVLRNPSEYKEQLAQYFEGLAAEARAGDIVGHSGILFKPGDRYQTVGKSNGDLVREIGSHVLMILSLRDHMQSND
jgi:hypothetical protein